LRNPEKMVTSHRFSSTRKKMKRLMLKVELQRQVQLSATTLSKMPDFAIRRGPAAAVEKNARALTKWQHSSARHVDRRRSRHYLHVIKEVNL
jgi:hypothetical protein